MNSGITRDFLVVIPSRYASVRLPGKPLAEIAGKPLLQHVYDAAKQSRAKRVIIATEDERVEQCAYAFGAEVIMTKKTHRSGTERIAEVVDILELPDETVVVNLQGDEFGTSAVLVDQVADILISKSEAAVATLCEPISEWADVFDQHVVKVVFTYRHRALYFSRAPIPWSRNQLDKTTPPRGFYRHIGLYAYRASCLRKYSGSPASPLEEEESLEQLKYLQYEEPVFVHIAKAKGGIGIDTEADLRTARAS